jgi:hypothetical protein
MVLSSGGVNSVALGKKVMIESGVASERDGFLVWKRIPTATVGQISL